MFFEGFWLTAQLAKTLEMNPTQHENESYGAFWTAFAALTIKHAPEGVEIEKTEKSYYLRMKNPSKTLYFNYLGQQ